jgi:hypothetical protein
MTRYFKRGYGIEVTVILVLLCTILTGCPPRKPTPVAASAPTPPDSYHTHDHQKGR